MPRLIASDLKPEERCLKVVRVDTGEKIERPMAFDTDEKWVEYLEENPDKGDEVARKRRLDAGEDPFLAASLFVSKYKTRIGEDGHAEIAPTRLYIDFDVLHQETGEVLHRVRR